MFKRSSGFKCLLSTIIGTLTDLSSLFKCGASNLFLMSRLPYAALDSGLTLSKRTLTEYSDRNGASL